jgi:multicomponent Na+:H+ antiporter subunit A
MMVWSLLAGFAGAAVLPLVHRLAPRASGPAAAALAAALFAAFALFLPEIREGRTLLESFDWVPALGIRVSFHLDGIALLFALLITGIGALVALYAGSYLAGHPHLGRFWTAFLLFMSSMLGLVLADNLLLLFVFWEMTSVSSYLLIGFDHEREEARSAALQALLVTGVGGLALLAGFVLLGSVGGSFEASLLLSKGESVREHALYLPILLLVLAGAFTKSAQVPFHFWLPNAMQAPTPVSAYLHSSTMVKAGIYLMMRLSPVLGGTGVWGGLLTGFGAVTMLVGAALAYGSTGFKSILAYTTVSALGTLTMLLGLGGDGAIRAAATFLLAHALYKGSLFLIAGNVDHATGERDVDRLGGLRRSMPITFAAAALSGLSMAGVPPLLGFAAKELVIEASMASFLLGAATAVGAALTVAAAGLVAARPFLASPAPAGEPVREVSWTLLVGPCVLAAGGLAAWWADPLLAAAASAIAGRPLEAGLSLWHGLTPALGLSATALSAGAGLYFGWARARSAAGRLGPLGRWGPERAYETAMRAIATGAALQTGALQSGRLRFYVLFVISVTLAGVGIVLFRSYAAAIPALPPVPLIDGALAILILMGTVAAVLARSRLGTLAALGAVGYGVALLFGIYGAPDLALTQFVVETLMVILFALILLRLPPYALLSSPGGRIRDAVVSIAAGAMMTALVLASGSGLHSREVTAALVERSVPEAHGRNVVNVILVDFRALDTLGEIAVLVLAAMGVITLLRIRPRKREAA